MKGLIKKTKPHFEGMKDPRTQCPALRHSYAGMLAMIAVAMMFAANGPTAVVRFWNDIAGHRPRRRHGLLRALGLAKIPSHDAVGRVMAATDPDALDQAVQAGRRLMARRGTAAARPRHIAVDGKACRGSASRANGVEAALVVNAVDAHTKRVLATVATPGSGGANGAQAAALPGHVPRRRPWQLRCGALLPRDAQPGAPPRRRLARAGERQHAVAPRRDHVQPGCRRSGDRHGLREGAWTTRHAHRPGRHGPGHM